VGGVLQGAMTEMEWGNNIRPSQSPSFHYRLVRKERKEQLTTADETEWEKLRKKHPQGGG